MYWSLYYVYLISDPDFGHQTQYPEVMQVLGQWERSIKRVGDERDQRRTGFGAEKEKAGDLCFSLPDPARRGSPLFPWPHPKRPSHGNLKWANSSWCVWMAREQSANTLANSWRQIELPSILANFFTNFFVLVNAYLTCEWLSNMC